MLKLKALKSEYCVKEGEHYLLGGVLQSTERVMLMSEGGNIVPGSYDPKEIFGMTTEEVITEVVSSGKPATRS